MWHSMKWKKENATKMLQNASNLWNKDSVQVTAYILYVYAITFLKNFLAGGPQVPTYISSVTFMNSGAANQERASMGQENFFYWDLGEEFHSEGCRVTGFISDKKSRPTI